MSLRVRFWGTRGSTPSPGPRTVRYGGNTPCVEVRTPADELIVLDAGTGIRDLGRSLLSGNGDGRVATDLYVTHAHWDHIQGLPFFAPAFVAGQRIRIWIAGPPLEALERAVREQMSPMVFPVRFEDLRATIDFPPLDGAPADGRSYRMQALPVRHPGGALGYRIHERIADEAPALVYVSDNELVPARDGPDATRDALVAFARGARVLVHDATYTEAEYESRRGWGHSTDVEALRLALDAGAKTLVLFHHAPDRSDDEIDAILARCREAAAGRLSVVAAAEGMELTA